MQIKYNFNQKTDSVGMFYKLLNAYTQNFSFPFRGLKYFIVMARRLGIENKTYRKKIADGFYIQVNPSEHIQQQLFWYGYYEKELGDLIKKVLQPGEVFLDIGANIGYFSLLAAKNVPTARVISFEPVQSLFQNLRENIAVNGFKNILAVNSAAGESNEQKDIFISGNDNLGMSSFQPPENFSGKKETVQVLSVDDWFKTSGLSKIDLVKLDVEGSESAALKGMNNILKQFKPLLIVEINPEALSMFGLTSSEIFNYLTQLNYDGFVISENGRLTELNKSQVNQTINVLFIHKDKRDLHRGLFVTQEKN